MSESGIVDWLRDEKNTNFICKEGGIDQHFDAELAAILASMEDESPRDNTTPSASRKEDSPSSSDAATSAITSVIDLIPDGFPVENINNLHTHPDPLTRLQALAGELRQHGDYLAVRDEYCSLSVQLNCDGKLAPAFRAKVKPGRKFGDPVYMLIHRDQIVIDSHWLHSGKQMVDTEEDELRPLFDLAGPFLFDLAWVFAQKKWSDEYRVNEGLRLTPFQQCQLAALRSPDVQKRLDMIEKGAIVGKRRFPSPKAKFVQALGEWCERDRRITAHRDSYIATWMARQMLGSGASVSLVAKLVALSLGEEQQDNKTIRSREKNIAKIYPGE